MYLSGTFQQQGGSKGRIPAAVKGIKAINKDTDEEDS